MKRPAPGRWSRPAAALLASLVAAITPPLAAQAPGSPSSEQADIVHPAGHVDLMPARDASGTAWQPPEVVPPRTHRLAGTWMVMAQAQIFAQVVVEPGERHRTGGASTHQISGTGWGMLMARRRLAGGRAGLRTMLSLDPLAVRDCGYLNLLATGEVCDGDTIHDRQHPHDLFMELAADYDHGLRGDWRWQVYAGAAGEPALGPPAFPHRLSALRNATAPIVHHWLDATHISFGVATAAIYERRYKFETSIFNAREPDDRRAGIEWSQWDSAAARLSWMPSPRLVVQASAGQLNGAEAGIGGQPRSDITRATLSATHHVRLAGQRSLATLLAYGRNRGLIPVPGASGFTAVTHAGLFEATWASPRDAWFGRGELVGKPAHDLHAHEYPRAIFTVARLQGGYARRVAAWSGGTVHLGAVLSLSLVPPPLAPRYGGRASPGAAVSLRVSPFESTAGGTD